MSFNELSMSFEMRFNELVVSFNELAIRLNELAKSFNQLIIKVYLRISSDPINANKL